MARVLLRLFALASVTAADDIMIATFDGAKGTTLTWKEMNDPVMGGKSAGTFTIDSANKVGIFDGKCAIVPSLKAPGFITAGATGSFPDISHCQNLVLNVNSANSFAGFRVSFGSEHYPPFYKHFFARGFKSDFQPPTGKFGDVVLPLKGFTDHWDDATGKAITTCAEDSKACPTQKRLQNLETVQIWGEGVEGDVHLQIKSIRASGCTPAAANRLEVESSSAGSGKSTQLDVPSFIDLATFDGKAPHKWHSENDPVMGGKSSSTVEMSQGFADYKGTTRIVPALKAPGFTIAMTEGFPFLSKFPDVSSMDGLTISVRNIGNFTGYKIAFCDSHINFYRCQVQSFKADLVVPSSADGGFQDVFVPWSEFSDKWNAATGKHTAKSPPGASSLNSITQLQIWTEAVEGDFHLQFQYVRASKAPVVTLLV